MNATLYHGTSKEAAKQIRRDGRIRGQVYLTPNRQIAAGYAGEGGEVLEVRVSTEALLIDLDMPGGIGLTPESATISIERQDDPCWEPTVAEFLAAGYSVMSQNSISI